MALFIAKGENYKWIEIDLSNVVKNKNESWDIRGLSQGRERSSFSL